MFEILNSDRAFIDSPMTGHPRCICSRCGERIRNSREGAIRAWDKEKNTEYRFHYRCLGIEESTWDDQEPIDWIEDLPEEYEEDYSYPELEELSLGACCVCGSKENVFNIINLPLQAPVPGTGWGNVETGLPADGAIAVVCNSCADGFEIENLRDVVYGYASERRRISFSEVAKNGDFP